MGFMHQGHFTGVRTGKARREGQRNACGAKRSSAIRANGDGVSGRVVDTFHEIIPNDDTLSDPPGE